jgi:hypothetical protein
MQRISLILGLWSILLSGGCESEVVEPSAGQIRSATDPKIVKLYHTAPRKYEILGDIQTTEHLQYGPNKSVDAMVEQLIEQAAAKGGNGVLLAVERPRRQGRYATYGGYYQEMFVQFLVRLEPEPEAVIAKAIYVLED